MALERVNGKVSRPTVRRAIAERLGWSVEKGGNSYTLLFPNGKPCSGGSTPEQSIAGSVTLPNYTADIGAAMGLLLGLDTFVWRVTSQSVLVGMNRVAYNGPDQLPLAICLAVLAYWGVDQLTVEEVEI